MHAELLGRSSLFAEATHFVGIPEVRLLKGMLRPINPKASPDSHGWAVAPSSTLVLQPDECVEVLIRQTWPEIGDVD